MNVAEVVTILLSLTGFGIQASPGAPSAAEVLRLAPDDADLVAHVDLAAFVPNNLRALHEVTARLPPTSEARVALDRGLGELALGRGAVKIATGVDPVDDVTSATGFLALEGEEHRFLVVVRGRFPADLMARSGVAQLGGAAFEVDGTRGLAMGEVAAAKIGKDLVIGHRPWVEARMKKGWKRKAGGLDGRVRRAFAGKPFFAVVVDPGEDARAMLARHLADPQLDAGGRAIGELLGHLQFTEMHFTRTGLGWTIGLDDADLLERARLWSEASFDLLRAYQYFALGAGKLGFALLPALRGEAPEVVDALLPHEKELLALLPQLAGDGRFTARVAIDRSGKQVTAEARARSVGQIVGPVPVLVLAGAFFALRSGDVEESAPVASAVAEPVEVRPIQAAPAPARVLDVGAIHRRVKAKPRPAPAPAP